MVLENFIVDAPIVWDRVGKKIFENPHVKQGRKMRVQITNAGMVEDLSGYTLALGWKHTVSGVDGLDVFEDSSEANVGIFEMAYTENLMTNLGNLKASLVLTSVEDMVVAESNDFYVKVDNSPFGADAEQGVGSYTRLAEILLNEESRIAAEVARVSAEETRVTDFNALVDSEIIAQNVATKLQAKEAEYLPRLVSNEQKLADKAEKKDVLTNDLIGFDVDFNTDVLNPVLTKLSVTDRPAQGVADPFIVFNDADGLYHLFFEVITSTTEEIGHATSPNGLSWTYDQVVLTEAGQHFAYPFTFKHDGVWYMIPDKGNMLSIYTTTTFPYGWTILKTYAMPAVDFTMWHWKDDKWYAHVREGLSVNLYYTDDFKVGPWVLHPSSPIIDASTSSSTIGARGAGNAIVYDNGVLVPIQGLVTTYGEYTKWYRLTDLTTTTVTVQEGKKFLEKTFPVKKNNMDYYDIGMHHISHVPDGSLDILIADSTSRLDAGNPNAWAISVMKKKPKQVLFTSESWQAEGLVQNTWTKLIKLGERFNGYVAFDTGAIWDEKSKSIKIQTSGIYRINYNVTTYGTRVTRNVKARVSNLTATKVLARSSQIIPQNVTGENTWNNNLHLSKLEYLEAGAELILEVFTTATGEYTLPNDGNTFFEIEKVR